MRISAGALRKMLYGSVGIKRKTVTATLISTLLASALAGALLVNLATANPMGIYQNIPSPSVTIQLPESKMYNTRRVPVFITVETAQVYAKWLVSEHRSYILDGRYFASLPRQLSEGTHKLRIRVDLVYVLRLWGYSNTIEVSGRSNEVVFTVNAAAPRVSVLEPKPAETYHTTKIQLNFSVSEPTNWLSYSLDDQAPVTITRNTTLYGIPDGTHTITVHAEDTTGSTGTSKPITFKVETQQATQPTEPQAETSPVFSATVVVASVAIVTLGFVAYFARVKRRKNKT